MPPLEQIWLRWGATKSVASVKSNNKQIKWRFLKYQPTKRKRIEIGRRIIDLSFLGERFDNGCCKCGQKFELKHIIKETNLGLCSTFHFICTNCAAISVLNLSNKFSKEEGNHYAVNVKASFGKYALCVYTLCLVCTSYNSYM